MANRPTVDFPSFARIARALGDENRLRALLALREGELCLCQIVDLLGLAPSTVSKHMTVLLQAGLVTARQQGRWHYYRLPAPGAPAEVSRSLEWAIGLNESNERVRADARRLRTVRRAAGPDACCGAAGQSRSGRKTFPF
jgi:DNA-binding transcriptional ArsR family regulator